MNRILLLCVGLLTLNTHLKGHNNANDGSLFDRPTEISDSLPTVLSKNHGDLIDAKLRSEAQVRFAEHQLPNNLKEWESQRIQLKAEIIKKTGVVVNHQLPLNIKETNVIQLNGYSVKNITFQTRPGIYATANLYIPDGMGPFPGIMNTPGHWPNSKIDSIGQQAVGHTLALNGYVCLTMDPWGAGERGTILGKSEYHGSNLGASLMNIGESLMGVQISENMRGVDLLCSLPNVDPQKIGTTGASGGGNQTMWLAAMDDRVKAAVPVVSVGTFESYVMEFNCICELLVDGLTFTEEAGILAMAKAIMPCNHSKDEISPAFLPVQMLRSYNNAKQVFKMRGEENNISCKIYDLIHTYSPLDRQAMLGWFDFHLKGIGKGAPKSEIPFKMIQDEKLLVFPTGKRDANILGTDDYCKLRGNELRTAYLNTKSFNVDKKKSELRDILRIKEKMILKKVYRYSTIGGWDRFALETSDDMPIPVLHMAPTDPSKGYVILCNPEGKNSILPSLIDDYRKEGSGILVVDLSGTGEVTSISSLPYDKIGKLHTLSRAELWLGKTVLGEWVKELNVVVQFLDTNYKTKKVSIDGSQEAGLAGLFLSSLEGNVDHLVLRQAPVSYLFDSRVGIDFFGMGIHLPGFLQWGDVSLAAALSGKNIQFVDPVTMSGNQVGATKLSAVEAEFEKVRALCHQSGSATFK
ncbi:MAG: acetylxylan esterase [Prolixibacteraceae bacterium]|nr:acetylxylan esterase [Prolixibacteraceae bacterium]